MKEHTAREIFVDVVVGGLIGGLVGAVVAVNFVLIIGVDQGYEASLGEVFAHSSLAGIVTLAILIAGPVTGFLAARRRRALSGAKPGTDVNNDRLAR